MMRIKKNDTVCIITGKDKNKTGKVIEILHKKDKVMIKGLALSTKHLKPRRQGEVAGIKEVENYIHSSKVMPVCTSCNKPVRVNAKTIDTGQKVRICNQCKEIF